MFKKPLVFFDLETTGLNPESDRIIEIGLVKVVNDNIEEEYSTLVNPGFPIQEIIQKLTGINDNELSEAPGFEQIQDNLLKLIDNSIIVAHNAIFDISFLNNELKRNEVAKELNYICSLQASRNLYSNYAKHNLHAIVERFHLDSGHRHRALSDAKTLYQFFSIIKAEKKQERFDHILEYLITNFKQ